MSEINDGGNAFPIPGLQHDAEFNGMTLRDYFAAKAMQARLSDYESARSLRAEADKQGIHFADEAAIQAYAMADAMLKARGES